MPDLRDLIQGRPRQPWDDVTPDQPVARIDPAALRASMAGQSPAGAPTTMPDEAMGAADMLARRQALVAQAAAPNAAALQSVTLTLPVTVWERLAQLIAKKSK